MELRAYWAILWRRLWLVALIFGVVALFAGYQYYHLRKTPGALKAYHSSTILQVGLQATTKGTDPSYADNVTVSESLADALATGPVLSTSEFETQVSQQIAADMGTIQQRYGANPDLGNWQDSGAIGGALSPSRIHSLVTIDVAWPTEAGSWAIATAVGEVLTKDIGHYLDYVVSPSQGHDTTASQVQPPVVARVISAPGAPALGAGTANSKQTLLLLLLLVGLIVGVALAFLVDYLDDRIRSKEDVAHLLHLPIYGELPRAPAPGSSGTRRVPSATLVGAPEK